MKMWDDFLGKIEEEFNPKVIDNTTLYRVS